MVVVFCLIAVVVMTMEYKGVFMAVIEYYIVNSHDVDEMTGSYQ